MPSRAVTSFLQEGELCEVRMQWYPCQCPLGLLPHFYSRAWKIYVNVKSPSVNALSGCYLISTGERRFKWKRVLESVNALSGCYLISTAYEFNSYYFEREACVNALSGCYLISTVPLQKPRFYAVSRACFCRYLSEYSDSNSFSCMLTIWTYFMM